MRKCPAKKKPEQNFVRNEKTDFIGRQVSKRRNELDWTQDYLADRLQDAGWLNATRSTVSKIEDGSLRIDLTAVVLPGGGAPRSSDSFPAQNGLEQAGQSSNLFPMKKP